MKIGIFGGSFDPIHRGHVEPVLAVLSALELDRVLYVPTAHPPHKPGAAVAAAHRRFAMTELALLDHPALEVSDLELTPGQPAYTVDTVTELLRRRPGDSWILLLGADSLAQLHTWRRWRELAAMVPLAVMARPGWRLDQLPSGVPEDLRHFAASDRVHRVVSQPVDCSSTEIRRCLGRGEDPPAGALSDLVLRYIKKYDLYS